MRRRHLRLSRSPPASLIRPHAGIINPSLLLLIGWACCNKQRLPVSLSGELLRADVWHPDRHWLHTLLAKLRPMPTDPFLAAGGHPPMLPVTAGSGNEREARGLRCLFRATAGAEKRTLTYHRRGARRQKRSLMHSLTVRASRLVWAKSNSHLSLAQFVPRTPRKLRSLAATQRSAFSFAYKQNA